MARNQSKKVYLVVGEFFGFRAPIKNDSDNVWGCPQVFESKKDATRLAEMMRSFCVSNGNMSRFNVQEAIVQPADPDGDIAGSIEFESVSPYRGNERPNPRLRQKDKHSERADRQAMASIVPFGATGSAA